MVQQSKPKRRYFLAGLFTVLPLVLTLYLFRFLVSFVGSFSAPFLQPFFNHVFGEEYHPFYLDLSSFVLTLIAVWIVGAIVTHLLFGRHLLEIFERGFIKIPFVSGIYVTMRKLTEFISPSSQKKYQKVVLVQFPQSGSYTLGFITADETEEVRYHLKKSVVNVFVPHTPNPISGFLLFVPQEDLIPLTMSVDDAFKMILSCGISVPKFEVAEVSKQSSKQI